MMPHILIALQGVGAAREPPLRVPRMQIRCRGRPTPPPPGPTHGWGPCQSSLSALDGYLQFRVLLFLLIDPAFDVPLFPRADCEGRRRHVFTNRRAAAHVGAGADCPRRAELSIAAADCAVVDDGLVLRRAIVVARDRAGA